LDLRSYSFDPNRIFTDVGLERSLRHNGDYSQAAHSALVRLRETLVAVMMEGLRPPIVAIHNNRGSDYTVNSYRRGASLESDASRVVINPNADPRNFFLVLDAAIFERLSSAGFNVVLQSNKSTDDGSLSVYCHIVGIPYVNVEAGFDQLSEQKRMLEELFKIFCGAQSRHCGDKFQRFQEKAVSKNLSLINPSLASPFCGMHDFYP